MVASEGLYVDVIKLWWEVPPWLSQVVLKGATSSLKVRSEGEG